ncbi:MAG: HTH domain-containing protein [Nanoarchaeota archaeon]|jgi:DNA-binding IclR family transcriptional regulator|nr:HTH domain-containing protein [Nanoarchaeota archaeon]
MANEKEVVELLNKNNEGLTITEIVDKSKFSRSTIRTILAKLEGARKVKVKIIGMAKLYTLK